MGCRSNHLGGGIGVTSRGKRFEATTPFIIFLVFVFCCFRRSGRGRHWRPGRVFCLVRYKYCCGCQHMVCFN